MQKVQQWIEDNQMKCKIKSVSENPHMRDMPEGSRHWLATFSTIRGGTYRLRVYYSTGPALTSFPNPLYGHPDRTVSIDQTKRIKHPSGAEILSCVADEIRLTTNHSDAIVLAVESGQVIESTEDVDRARAVWNLILEHRKGLERLVGVDTLRVLLYDTEES